MKNFIDMYKALCGNSIIRCSHTGPCLSYFLAVRPGSHQARAVLSDLVDCRIAEKLLVCMDQAAFILLSCVHSSESGSGSVCQAAAVNPMRPLSTRHPNQPKTMLWSESSGFAGPCLQTRLLTPRSSPMTS